MTIDSFITYWNGIYCDFDGNFGDQCFDLANSYSRWIGGPRFLGATADLIINQAGTFYTQILNTDTNFPQKGDIVVWNWPHVGIATGDNTDKDAFDCLEQNDPTDSDCHLKHYSYSGVIGWLHPITLPIDQQTTIDQLREARDSNWNLYQTQLQHTIDQETTIEQNQKTINTLIIQTELDKQTIDNLTKAKQTLSTSLSELTQKQLDTQNKLDIANGLLANRKDLLKWDWWTRFWSLFERSVKT